MFGPSLLDAFAVLKDPRQSRKMVFALPEVLLLVLCGTLAGAENFVEIRRWGQTHPDVLRRCCQVGGSSRPWQHAEHDDGHQPLSITAAQHRAARDTAFEVWRDMTGTAKGR